MNRLHGQADAAVAETTSRMVSIISGKGGVGKSVVTYNLAERLVESGFRVLMIDADFTGGNLHILANVEANHGIAQLFIDQLSLNETIITVSERLDLVASPSMHAQVDPGNFKRSVNLAAHLRRQAALYDFILIDHGSGVSKAATAMANASDLSLLVVVPELTSISDCYGLYKHLTETNTMLDCRLLVNRAESEGDAQYLYTKFAAMAERFLGRWPEYCGHLPEDKSFRQSVAGQQALAAIDAQSAATQAITRCAARVVQVLGTANDSHQFTRQINKNPATADTKG
jgi:flagellar biosynthesis protein FlhG